MTMADKPVITVVHQLPGRLRLRVSHAPKDPESTMSRVKAHPGIFSMKYTALSDSLLVLFNPLEISAAEIVMRIAYSLSVDYDLAPIRILAEPENRELSAWSFYSALALVMALLSRSVNMENRTTRALDWIAGAGTAGAVVAHGWRDVRAQGYIDPEVLSVVYLAAAFFRGQFLSAALVTWLATFGRHLFKPTPAGVELRVAHTRERSGARGPHGIIVGPDHADKRTTKFLRFIPALVQYALIGGSGSAGTNLLGDIRDVANVHDEVLEGLGELTHGIPIRIA